MSRLASFALVAAVAVLALAAVVDAVVGREEAPPAPVTTAGDDVADALAEAGIRGRLLYTDAGDCRLRGLALPALEPVDAPDWDTCAFALGPAAAVVREGAVFDRRAGLRAEEFDGGVDVLDLEATRGRRIENARAPAFRPDGTLTLVRRGALVSLPPCPGAGPPIARVGPCGSTIVTEKALTALAPVSVEPRPLRLAVEAVVWLDDERLALLADAGGADVLLGVDTRGASPDVEVWFEDERLSGLFVGPRLRRVAVVTSTGELGVWDERGRLLGLRGTQVRAAAWSPDERWLAVLDGDGVLFVDGRNGEGVGPVPLAARDLAWD